MSKAGKFIKTITLWDLWKGLGLTMRHIFRGSITTQYPDQRREIPERFRGRHRMRRYDDGTERCVACCLCAAVCPSNAIYIEPAERPDGQRYAKVYEVDAMRCIYCGFCVEACPYDAIEMTQDYELAEYDKESLIWDKDRLMEPAPGGASAGQEVEG